MNELPIGNRLARGNKKLADTIGIWSLPAVKTCPNCAECAKTCYARKAEAFRPSVKLGRARNLSPYVERKEALKAAIVAQITRQKIQAVRIHESGDFFDQAYIGFWADIVKSLPAVKFYAYTKTAAMFDFAAICALSNFNLVSSFLPDGCRNYGKAETIIAQAQAQGVPVCPCRKGDTEKVCGSSCTICQTEKFVAFIQH